MKWKFKPTAAHSPQPKLPDLRVLCINEGMAQRMAMIDERGCHAESKT
jgi:hypothetical protein